jgi:hypothetical protein
VRNLNRNSTECVQILDGIHRGILERALEQLKEGKDCKDIIDETIDALELL